MTLIIFQSLRNVVVVRTITTKYKYDFTALSDHNDHFDTFSPTLLRRHCYRLIISSFAHQVYFLPIGFFFFCSTRAHSDTFTYYRGHVYGDGVMLFNTDSIRGDSIGVFFLFFFSLFSVDTRYYQRRYCIIRPSSDDVRIVVVVYAVVIRVVAVSPGDVRRGERLFPKRSKKSKSFVHKTIYFHIVVQEREGKKRTRRCAPFYARHPKQQLLWRTTVT